MHILYYITSHGYGHAVRSAAVCNALYEATGVRIDSGLISISTDIRKNVGIDVNIGVKKDIGTDIKPGVNTDVNANIDTDVNPDIDGFQLTISSDVPQSFFKEELPFPHNWRSGGFDVGCLQSDGVSVLVHETLEAYLDISINNKLRIDSEARWCIDNGVDCIVGDITPFAFEAADRAGIPSVAISNFTWHDIYSPYVERFPEYGAMLAEMADQYRKASIALTLYPASLMPIFDRKKAMPILGRRGVDRRNEICRLFGIDAAKRLGVIYVGNFGLGGIDWGRLEGFDGWEFVGVYPLPGGPKNYHLVSKDQFRYQDLSASADAIIAKMGYGVFSESMLNGIPLVYLPRDGFAEFPVLDAEAKRLGSGVCIDTEAFCGFGWAGLLNLVVDNNRMKPADGGGAGMCAGEVLKIADL